MDEPLGQDSQPNLFADQRLATTAGPRNWVGHVRILSILCVIQGGAELLIGGACLFFGLIVPTIMTMPIPGGQPALGPGSESMTMMLTVIYAVVGIVLLTIGILRIVASLRTFQFRGRAMGIVSLSAGILGIVFILCLPTAIGLMIYGMMILLDPEVAAAFEARRSGLSVAQILARHGA